MIPNLHKMQRRAILEYSGALWGNASRIVDGWRDWQEGPGRMTQGDLVAESVIALTVATQIVGTAALHLQCWR